jgi:ribosomal protein S18 acetylase RimI-like enzyme
MAADDVSFRRATHADAPTVAALHADSWRRNYRGAYPEEFFGPSLDDDRSAVWQARLRPDATGTATVLAELEGRLAGFVHVVLHDDPAFGALVDNLHVRHDLQRRGIASQLMARAAAVAVDDDPSSGLFLWVLEQNTRAQAFYRVLGGLEADRRVVDPPALDGVRSIRIVWPDARSVPGQ